MYSAKEAYASYQNRISPHNCPGILRYISLMAILGFTQCGFRLEKNEVKKIEKQLKKLKYKTDSWDLIDGNVHLEVDWNLQ